MKYSGLQQDFTAMGTRVQ